MALETSARRDGDEWVINGAKKWIGNGTIADVVVVWARDVADGQVKGFLVEKGTPGYEATRIDGKGSLRAVWQAEISLTDLRVPRGEPAARRTQSSRTPAGCSPAPATRWPGPRSATPPRPTRSPWPTAVSVSSSASRWSSFQIVQEKLVRMLAEVCSMQLYCLRLGRLIEEGRLTDTIAAIAKMNNTRKARQVIAEARDLLGGNGILLDFHVHAAHGRHRGDPHLRGHGDHADPHRRQGHHRCRRLHLTGR